jgi:SAM-dependent methyltransferase
MSLIQEYKKQQNWRNWERYLESIPYSGEDTVVDLGCSVGDVSQLFSLRVKNVIGIDVNQDFIDICESQKGVNQTFICSDFLSLDSQLIESTNGIWSSFSLSYLRNPLDFLIYLNASMKQGGWIALLDISCFISGNLAKKSQYYEKVLKFELESYKSGIYDFDFGSKMLSMLQNAGFDIVYLDNDVTDPELNFTGAASAEIIHGWAARLNRMNRLKDEIGAEYPDFCNELLANLSSDTHEKRQNVRFIVARKPITSVNKATDSFAGVHSQ